MEYSLFSLRHTGAYLVSIHAHYDDDLYGNCTGEGCSRGGPQDKKNNRPRAGSPAAALIRYGQVITYRGNTKTNLQDKRATCAMKARNELANLQRLFSTHSLTCDAPVKAWARFGWWQLKSRCQGEILFQWISGQRLAVRRGMVGATANIYVGLLEFADMMLLLHFLREGDLFLDIGANVGAYTVLASGVCRARTWAFEPDPTTVERLKRNITINSLDALVRVCEFALGAERGEVAFTMVATQGTELRQPRKQMPE